MKKFIKKILRKLFLCLFQEELNDSINKIKELERKSQDNIDRMENFINFVGADVGIDFHVNSPNWVLFCLKGKKQDMVKLIRFDNDKPIIEIMKFVKLFDQERIKADTITNGMHDEIFRLL